MNTELYQTRDSVQGRRLRKQTAHLLFRGFHEKGGVVWGFARMPHT